MSLVVLKYQHMENIRIDKNKYPSAFSLFALVEFFLYLESLCSLFNSALSFEYSFDFSFLNIFTLKILPISKISPKTFTFF